MRISGAGCCLLDSVFNGFDINSEKIKPLLSKNKGDGGLKEGNLVFFDSLQNYSNLDYKNLFDLLSNEKKPDATNLGGPAIVAMVNASQMLEDCNVSVRFEGVVGDDFAGKRILDILSKTPLESRLSVHSGAITPKTMVLAGSEDRTFVNDIGVAKKMHMSDLSHDFFTSDIVLLGGTAIVPNLHNDLSLVLKKVKENGGITVVGTVYDYASEQKNPHAPWQLLKNDNWEDVDILVMDAEEALRISGTDEIAKAAAFFENKVHAFIITQGKDCIWVWAGDNVFKKQNLVKLPVSCYIDSLLKENPSLRHDSTGCGDNFAGGVVASIAKQKLAGCNRIDIIDCCAWGAACGGFTLLYSGGTFIESKPQEKLKRVYDIVLDYKKQIEDLI